MSTLSSPDSLEDCFNLVNKLVQPILDGNVDRSDNDYTNKALTMIENCKGFVQREHIFSSNEELDDLLTSTIKYLYLDYYSAKSHLQNNDQKCRKLSLYEAKEFLKSYLQTLCQLSLLHESEVSRLRGEDSSKPTAEANRTYKIEKYKREKAGKERMKELQRLLAATREDVQVDHEEELRELLVAQAQSFARDALDELDMIDQELSMLQFQDRLEQSAEEDDDRERRRGSSSSSSSGRNTNGGLSLAQQYAQPVARKGISVTKTYKVGDQLVMSRDTVHSTVFGSSIAPPTMSLAEYGDQQLREAQERSAAQENAVAGPRRYNQLADEGLEDDDRLVEEAAVHDRAWDDWKAENPRGSGNKMGKRF